MMDERGDRAGKAGDREEQMQLLLSGHQAWVCLGPLSRLCWLARMQTCISWSNATYQLHQVEVLLASCARFLAVDSGAFLARTLGAWRWRGGPINGRKHRDAVVLGVLNTKVQPCTRSGASRSMSDMCNYQRSSRQAHGPKRLKTPKKKQPKGTDPPQGTDPAQGHRPRPQP